MKAGDWRIVRMLAGYPGYLHKVRGALLAVSVFVVTMAGLGAAAVPGAVEFRQAREVGITPSSTTPHQATFVFMISGADRLWSGRRVIRVFVAPWANTTVPERPPGTKNFPAAGEAFVSPHLRALIGSDPVARSLLGDARVVGTIAPAGLAEPDENRAIIGLSAATATRLTPAATWGAPPVPTPGEVRVVIVLGLFLGLLVLVPAIALAAITARLGETERGDRAAVLRMLGAPPRVAARVSGAEVALVGLPASIAAVATFGWLVGRGVRVPVVDLTVFPDAARIPWPVALLVVLASLGLHCGMAARLAARGRVTLQPILATQPLRLRSLWLLVGGVLILVGLALVSALPSAVAGVAFFAGATAVALSLGTALPTAIRWLARRVAPCARRGGTLYGLRLLAERTLPSVRIAALMALLLVALGTAVPFLAILNGGGSPGLAQYASRHPRTVVSVFDAGFEWNTRATLSRDAIATRMFTAQANTGEGVTVWAATCGDLRNLLTIAATSCPDGPTWVSDETMLPPSRVAKLRTSSGWLPVPSTERALHVSDLPGELGGLLLLTPAVAGTLRMEVGSSGIVASIPTNDVDRFLARVSAIAPWAQTRTDTREGSNPDERQYTGTSQLVILAAWTSLVLATLTLLAASLGEVAAQRRRTRELDILGARGTDFARLHCMTTSGPLLVAGFVATVVSGLVGRSLLHMDDRAHAPPAMYVAMAVGTVIVSALTSILTAPLNRPGFR